MSKIVIIAGHGLQPSGRRDPGAVGNGTSEDSYIRNTFMPLMKKYAPSNMDFYTEKDVFGYRSIANFKKYDVVVELHMDAASAGAEDGHVIIYKNYNADNLDNRIVDVIKKNVGIRYGGLVKRDNLYNVNQSAKLGINYRLVELCFITNKNEMAYMLNKTTAEKYAKELVEAITGSKSTVVNKPVVKDSDVYVVKKGDSLWAIAEKYNTTVANLKNINNLKSDTIAIGVKLKVDGAKDTVKVPNAKPVVTTPKKKYNLTTKVLVNQKPIMFGSDVKVVQEALSSIYFYPDKGAKNNGIDSYYGGKTADAVKRFQSVYGLSVDGKFGTKTRAKLDSLVNK